MARYCFLSRVRPDRMEEYRRRHAAAWPEMLQALAETGWRVLRRPGGRRPGRGLSCWRSSEALLVDRADARSGYDEQIVAERVGGTQAGWGA